MEIINQTLVTGSICNLALGTLKDQQSYYENVFFLNTLDGQVKETGDWGSS
jgi:hypothetical protein